MSDSQLVWPQPDIEVQEDGMYSFTWELDPEVGAQIAAALTAKESEMWRNEDPSERRTPQQRMADALVELILESQTGVDEGLG